MERAGNAIVFVNIWGNSKLDWQTNWKGPKCGCLHTYSSISVQVSLKPHAQPRTVLEYQSRFPSCQGASYPTHLCAHSCRQLSLVCTTQLTPLGRWITTLSWYDHVRKCTCLSTDISHCQNCIVSIMRIAPVVHTDDGSFEALKFILIQESLFRIQLSKIDLFACKCNSDLWGEWDRILRWKRGALILSYHFWALWKPRLSLKSPPIIC